MESAERLERALLSLDGLSVGDAMRPDRGQSRAWQERASVQHAKPAQESCSRLAKTGSIYRLEHKVDSDS